MLETKLAAVGDGESIAVVAVIAPDQSVESEGHGEVRAKELTLAYVFNAQKQDLQESYHEIMKEGCIAEHNAEAVDIQLEHDNIHRGNQARARTRKRARILMLVAKKWQALHALQLEFMIKLKDIVDVLNGKIEPDTTAKQKDRNQVLFPDGSIAKYPKGLFIPFDEFKKAE